MDAVGRYRIERRVGAGAFSTVWLAHDDDLDVSVAIKILSDNWIDNADVRARFIDEAKLLRRISDPGIIGVVDIGRLSDGRDYFVMDYADGGTLADLCRDPVPVPTALRLCDELAGTVARLHEHGILHRDIKPANVLITTTDDGVRTVLSDLGTAKRLAEASGLTMTVGTPSYMAPEQAAGLGLDERADVYGLAAVCYRLLSGEVPYPDESLADVATRQDRMPPPLPEIANLPADVPAAVLAGLSTDPADRPPTADAFRRLLTGSSTSAGHLSTRRAGRGPLSHRERGAPVVAAILACVAAVTTWLVLSWLVPH